MSLLGIVPDSERVQHMENQDAWVQEYVDRTGRTRWQPRHRDQSFQRWYDEYDRVRRWRDADSESTPVLYRSKRKAQRIANKKATARDKRFRELI